MSTFGYLLYLVPKNLLSFLVGKLVNMPLPEPLAKFSVKWFMQRYQIQIREAEFPLDAYKTIGQLFTRRLKPGLRPIGEGVVHPSDSQVTRAGQILNNQLVQAKGKTYSLAGLIGDKELAAAFIDGYYLTYYLCPTDYHRVHSPVSGEITSCVHIPGRLWPVNPWSVEHISQLFSVNERVIVQIRTGRGLLLVVMVGATNVGKITLNFDSDIVTNQSHWRAKKVKNYAMAIPVQKGQELGTFNMGSTVIVVAQSHVFPGLPRDGGKKVKLGESLVF